MSEFKCANCELCGKEMDAALTCSIILNDEDKKEKACWCVCKDCMDKFNENIRDYYKALIDDKPQK
ncbi:hypothetical protein [Phosphitispora fastidiosa]|uniref:hypothetical protein n=1 Tax=Phosphitispora fastidiosa TaxID=2837202 RepID=UPI001E4740BE|nr:hypothetical protein [Phosphitispora fastidiosa]MBU7008583.1 ribosome-binding protein aMBF1 (putative translation factor) [Phosphitispora fastidiosa]